ncbi:fimbrial biogenesis outer membrane usher protein [Brevundimonas lenta]|uniref:Outer membrane usher protein n=1 Tax=Brevundimonas lenta TaxID=424796 RepID=A0A7W6JBZ0_9CAUL|nr:fimbrial biogenesis outer membrane usher protein [Brevundimonas lenta]MBB4082330.1 outer membrane usher protein [Brevundimonas lenta]
MFAGGRLNLLAKGACLTAVVALNAPAPASAAAIYDTFTTGAELGGEPPWAMLPVYTAVVAIDRDGADVSTPSAPWWATPTTASVRSIQEQAAPRINPSGRTVTMIVPLKDAEIYLGDIEVQVGADDTIQVSAAQAFELLSRGLDPSALEPLRAVADPGVFVPLDRFSAAGLPLNFNPRTLELVIDIPAAARGRQSIGLADLDRELYGDFTAPAMFSAYVNLRGAVDYVHQGPADNGFGEGLVVLDGAARFGSIVLESEGAWDGGDSQFQRDGTRFVYDDTQRLNRWTVGDLQTQTRGFQGVQDVAGVGVVKSYSLMDPQRNIVPRGGRSFTLDRESTVDAYINGRSIRTIRLQPGTYDLNDFPFVQGSNDVDLIISDSTGQRETISFSLFIDRTQLSQGLSEYGFYGGVRSERAGGDIEYSDDLVATGFYRRGVSDTLTLGANFQYAETGSVASSMVAGEAVWGSPIGTFGADVAVSDNDAVGGGWAANVSFERLIQDAGGGFSLLATLEARSRRFGAPGLLAPDNPYEMTASVGVNKSFGDSAFAGVQLRYAAGRGNTEDQQSIRVSYGQRITENTNIILDADWADGGFADGLGFRVALVHRFGDTGSVRAEYDSESERGRLGYQTSGGRGVGAWSATANVDMDDSVSGLNAAASYAANRADLGLAHTTAYSQTLDSISDQRTSLRAATGIAFADGRFAVGRPVSDGFVIVEPYKGARNVMIEVEPSPDGFYARSGAMGPALYGQVTAYSPRSLAYDAPEAPAGFDVGQGAVRILPPYRAGYLVTVGSDYGVTAIGRLLDGQGQPVPLLAGVAIEQGGEGRRVEVFTNRQGTFGASGLKAGRWRIELSGDNPLAYDLIVPDAPDGVARVGDLRPAS